MIAAVLEELESHGVLLKTDAKLPSVCALIAGEPVRGSWWAHPMSHKIFHALNQVAARDDVLMVKLISGKDTFVHRSLWPALLAVAMSRERWQLEALDSKSRTLLAAVDRKGEVEASGSAALALEKLLLVHGEQEHTETGAHGKLLQSWAKWMERAGFEKPALKASEGRESIEQVVARLNARYSAKARLPWRSA